MIVTNGGIRMAEYPCTYQLLKKLVILLITAIFILLGVTREAKRRGMTRHGPHSIEQHVKNSQNHSGGIGKAGRLHHDIHMQTCHYSYETLRIRKRNLSATTRHVTRMWCHYLVNSREAQQLVYGAQIAQCCSLV